MDLTGEQTTSKLIGLCICSTDLAGEQAALNIFSMIGGASAGSYTKQEKSFAWPKQLLHKICMQWERLNRRPVKFIESAGGSAGTMLTLISRPKRRRRKDCPGFHWLCMHLIMVEFHWHRRPFMSVCLWRQNGYSVLHGQDTYTCTIVFIIAFITRDLDHTLSNALQWVGTPMGRHSWIDP